MLTAETAATAKVMAKKSAMEREVIVGVGFAIDTIICDNAQEFMPPRLRRRQRSCQALRCGAAHGAEQLACGGSWGRGWNTLWDSG